MIKKISLFVIIFISLSLNAQLSLDWALDIDNVNSNSTSSINDIEVDPSGNVYIIGSFSGSVDFDPGPGTDIRIGDWNDVFLQKYNSSGTLQWTRAFGGTSNDHGYRIELDASNNIYTLGQFGATVDFNPGTGITSVTSAGSLDVFVQKFSTNGTFQWVKTFGGIDADLPCDFKRDLSGNLLITGYFNGTADFNPGVATANKTALGYSDAYVLKLNSNGDFLWVATMGGLGTDYGEKISIDGSGNVYSIGKFTQTVDLDPGVGTSNFTASTEDLYIQKLNSSGVFQWAKTISGASGILNPCGMTVKSGFIYLSAGFTNTIDFDPGSGVVNHVSNGNSDIVILKLNDNGNYTWSVSIGGLGGEFPYGFNVNTANEVIITGMFDGTVDFDPGIGTTNLISNGLSDIFCIKLGVSGNLSWATSFGGTNNEWGHTIISGTNGAIYLAGNFNSSLIDFDSGPGEANVSCSTSIWESYFLKLTESSTSTTLAVELSDFSCHQEERSIEIKWRTESELNSDYFLLEKSEDGVQFHPFVQTKAQGNTSLPTDYFISDITPETGINYYRLNEVDMNGERKTYNITACDFNMFSMKIKTARIYSMNGTLLSEINGEDINLKETFSTLNLPDAVYILETIDYSGHIERIKFVQIKGIK
jgi:hypothetical protein